MNIALVGVNAKYFHSNLALRYLAHQLHDSYSYSIHEFSINDKVSHIVAALANVPVDGYLFSTYLWNSEIILEIVTLLKQLFPQRFLVLGGPEVASRLSFYQNSAADFLCTGSGEAFMLPFMQFCAGQLAIEKVPNLHYPIENQWKFTFLQEKLALPLYEPDFRYDRFIYLETSRGCPFRCTYCLSGTDTKVTNLSLPQVDQLLTQLNGRSRQFKFVDRTFNLDEKRTLTIWEKVLQLDPKTSYHFEICGDLLTEKMLAFLAETNPKQFRFEIGIQSFDPAVTRAIQRRNHIPRLQKNVRFLLTQTDIHLHLDLIIGLPLQNLASVETSFNQLFAWQPHDIQLGYLKVLPGTKMETTAQAYRFVYSRKAPYEIYATPWLNAQEIALLKMMSTLAEKIYNSGRFPTLMRYLTEFYPNAFRFFYRLAKFWTEHDFAFQPISLRNLYVQLYRFAQAEVLPTELIRNVLLYDFCLQPKRETPPQELAFSLTKEEYQHLKSQWGNHRFIRLTMNPEAFPCIERGRFYMMMSSQDSALRCIQLSVMEED